MKYAIVFTRGDSLPRQGDFGYMCQTRHQMTSSDDGLQFEVVSTHRVFNSPLEAREHRAVSGDLVVEVPSLNVCQSTDWLWPHELKDVNSYPQRMQRKDKLARGI